MVPPSLFFLLLLAPLSVLALQPEEPPVCQATDREDWDTCGLWFAKSTFNANEFGLYAGKARSTDEHVAEPDVLSKCLVYLFCSTSWFCIHVPCYTYRSLPHVFRMPVSKNQYRSTTPTLMNGLLCTVSPPYRVMDYPWKVSLSIVSSSPELARSCTARMNTPT